MHHSPQLYPWAALAYCCTSNVLYLMLSMAGRMMRVWSSFIRVRMGSALKEGGKQKPRANIKNHILHKKKKSEWKPFAPCQWASNSTKICLKHIEEIIFTVFSAPWMMLGAAAAGCWCCLSIPSGTFREFAVCQISIQDDSVHCLQYKGLGKWIFCGTTNTITTHFISSESEMSECDTYPSGKLDKRWNQIKQNTSGEKWGTGKYTFFFTSLHEEKG